MHMVRKQMTAEKGDHNVPSSNDRHYSNFRTTRLLASGESEGHRDMKMGGEKGSKRREKERDRMNDLS